MIRAMLPCILVLASVSSGAAEEYSEPAAEPQFSPVIMDGNSQQCCCHEADGGFIHRLFNFRPWTVESRMRTSAGTPGLPRGRRYFGGRYFGQFNNRFYGPQYGNF